MRLLLDTHVFLWMHALPERLSARTRSALVDARTELVVSVAAVWEIGIKMANHKLSLPEPLEEFVLSRAHRSRIAILPIQLRHVIDATDLPSHHRDPFDRIMIAQARIEQLAIVTGDPWFSRYQVELVAA